jgi:hypothetical protein
VIVEIGKEAETEYTFGPELTTGEAVARYVSRPEATDAAVRSIGDLNGRGHTID